MHRFRSLCLLPLVLLASAMTAAADGASPTLRLTGPAVELEVAPRLGGRVLHFSLPGAPNLLRIGEEVRTQSDPQLRADADNIGYMGHEVWVGPQADWWKFQTLNPARREAAAIWPPDPWLAHAPAKVLEHGDSRVRLQGAASPVSGVQLTQSFALVPQQPDTVELAVEMRNVHKTPIARNIWFNTRVDPRTRVYVPVAADGSGVRVRSDTGDGFDGLVGSTEDGLFSLELPPPSEGLQGRRGKVFIQPSAGWMVGFAAGQAFVIRFEHQPAGRIHPDQGQVELYLQWQPGQPEQGVLEMEVHAPYVTLEPGASTTAHERWTVRRYDGPDRRDAQVAFLRRLLHEIGAD